MIFTGQAFILRVAHDDPATVYYPLWVSHRDVGDDVTGWTADLEHDNRLHLTAGVFTIRAMQSSVRSDVETWLGPSWLNGA